MAALTAAAGGCSSNAFITRRRDLPVEAEIVGGSVNYVFVRDSGGEASIERIDIADVSHPGTERMVAGSLITFSSFLPVFPSLSNCGNGAAGQCFGALLPFAVGLAVLAWGVAAHTDSAAALKDRSRFDPDAKPVLRRPRPR